MTLGDAQYVYNQGHRLAFTIVRLDAYRNGVIPPSALASLSTSFNMIRQAGLKVIPRFVYNYPESETEYRNAQDASLPRVLEHIAQLKPVLQANSDVIAYFQAGFIGAWGEWHTSSNRLTTTANMASVRDALLDALPSSRYLQVRYPAALMGWSPTVNSNARIGIHNDCFMSSTTDVGTYSENSSTRQAQRSYVGALSRVAPFGGETCNPADEQGAMPRTSCADILREGAEFGLSYLNSSYYTTLFHDNWQAQGCFDEVKRKMGYRVELVNISHSGEMTRGGNLAIGLTVRNTGWARPFNARPVQVVLKHKTSGAVQLLALNGVDISSWAPGQDIAVNSSISLPTSMPTGAYDVHVAMPDPASGLRGDPRYAIRPANAAAAERNQGWDAQLGAFRTGTSITVQ